MLTPPDCQCRVIIILIGHNSRDDFAAASRRCQRHGAARLVLVDLTIPTEAAPALPSLLSLEEFVTERGLDDFAEAEQLAAYEAETTDVAFLDIRMPGLSGIEVAKIIQEKNAIRHTSCLIVFATAYEQHAVEAFEQHAMDYLLKPVRQDRLQDTVSRLKQQLAALSSPSANRSAADQALAKLIQTLQAAAPAITKSVKPKLQWINATVGDSVRMFSVAEVVYFQSSDKYTRVVMHKDETVIRTPIKDLLECLDTQEFWQIHRGTVVRASCIAKATRDDLGRLNLHLRDRKEILPVSQAYVYLFKGI